MSGSVVRLDHAEIAFHSWGCETRFQGAQRSVKSVPAYGDPHYSVIAHRCGYLDDLLTYCWEHDLAHLFVEQKLFARPSRVLSSIAEGRTLTGAESAYEELAAQTLQAFARANVEPIVAGVDWRGLRDEFRSMVQ